VTRAALVILAALALLLARRSPAWRPLAASLCAIAAIDVARLWTAPLAAVRDPGWWHLDVALVALWPVALAWPLRRGLTRPAPLAALAIALGACRPGLPVLAYLGTLRALRWGLAGLWVEALVWAWKDEWPRTHDPGPPAGSAEEGPRPALQPDPGVTPARVERTRSGEHARDTRAAQACALILAGCNVAGLLAGAWLGPPWEMPTWALAGPVTWAAYVAAGVVMVGALARRW